MPDRVIPGPVPSDAEIREAVCVHTDKIFDSCKAKECLEDLRVYLTETSQTAVECATGMRSRFAELLYVSSEVTPIQFNRGFFTVDLTFYYRIRGEVSGTAATPAPISGLAVYDKRVLLYGSEGNAKIYRSDESVNELDASLLAAFNTPTAIVEALEPIVLDVKIVDTVAPGGEVEIVSVPEAVAKLFDSPLVFDAGVRRVYVTLGQFSIVRLERDAQLLIPAYDYCIPDKDCIGADSDDPCTLFSRIDFPVDEFFPPDTLSAFPDTYREVLNETVQ